MSNLIPELRTDKNGVTSTRWVRPADNAANKNSTLPVPAIPERPTVNYRAGIEKMLYSKALEFGDDHTKFYSKASEDMLSYIYECLVADEDPDSTLRGQLSCLMNDNAEEHVIEAWLDLRDMHDEEYSMDDMGEVDYIRGAIESGTSPLNTYDRHNPEHAKTVRVLYEFLYKSDAEEHGTRVDVSGVTSNGIPASSHQITNPALADYLVNHPDQIDSLIDVGNDHPEWLHENVFNSSTEMPNIFREYLDTTAPLQNGVL
jgi:hypothetical protein